MNKNSNTYIIIYASVMVVIVALLLVGVSLALKSRQDANVEIDRQSQVLASLNIRNLEKDAVQKTYTDAVKEEKEIDFKGEKYSLFVCEVEGATKYVIPVKGRGLWGGLWGYIAVNADGETVFGTYFSHEGETAGLGALIAEQKFQDSFKGKQLFADTLCQDIALTVVKNGKVEKPDYQVDGITGSTLTSNGVANMLHDGLQPYVEFFNTLKK